MEMKPVCNIFYAILLLGLICIAFIHNNIVYGFGVILVFIFLGASIVIPAIFIPRKLGAKTGSEVFGLLTTSLILAHIFTFIPK